eukprot:jgi/Mesen1/5483/ME000276S04613
MHSTLCSTICSILRSNFFMALLGALSAGFFSFSMIVGHRFAMKHPFWAKRARHFRLLAKDVTIIGGVRMPFARVVGNAHEYARRCLESGPCLESNLTDEPARTSSKKDPLCPVCLTELGRSEGCLTRCEHQFHEACLEDFLTLCKVCPFCYSKNYTRKASIPGGAAAADKSEANQEAGSVCPARARCPLQPDNAYCHPVVYAHELMGLTVKEFLQKARRKLWKSADLIEGYANFDSTTDVATKVGSSRWSYTGRSRRCAGLYLVVLG